MTESIGKKVIIKSVNLLTPGLELTLHDFQVSASDNNGAIYMVDVALKDPEPDSMVEYKLQPGAWRVTPKGGMQPIELQDELYIETSVSKMLTKHFTTFFNKLSVYERKKLLPATRKILLGSEPGMGKSACIRAFLRKVKHEPGMCILKVDSADVSWETMTQMFMKAKKDAISRMVLVIEDIGGTALNDRNNRVEPDLLNFLSGNSDIFKVPTLVIGTTNFLNELGPTLNDRPGRFDVVQQLDDLSDEDTTIIVETIEGRELTAQEKQALLGRKFTPAYCLEALLRAELHETSIEEAVAELFK